jgi:hypothetical protein
LLELAALEAGVLLRLEELAGILELAALEAGVLLRLEELAGILELAALETGVLLRLEELAGMLELAALEAGVLLRLEELAGLLELALLEAGVLLDDFGALELVLGILLGLVELLGTLDVLAELIVSTGILMMALLLALEVTLIAIERALLDEIAELDWGLFVLLPAWLLSAMCELELASIEDRLVFAIESLV